MMEQTFQIAEVEIAMSLNSMQWAYLINIKKTSMNSDGTFEFVFMLTVYQLTYLGTFFVNYHNNSVGVGTKKLSVQ